MKTIHPALFCNTLIPARAFAAVLALAPLLASYGEGNRLWDAGGGDDTSTTNQLNWAGDAVPTSNMSFSDAAAGKTVTFSTVHTLTDTYVWIGSTTADKMFTDGSVTNPVVWEASSPENGFTASSAGLKLADTSSQNGALWIKGGTYKPKWFEMGKGAAYFRMDGGTIDVGNDIFYIANANGGIARVELNGGLLKGRLFNLGNAASTASLKMTGGAITTTEFFDVGQSDGSTVDADISGGTLTIGYDVRIAACASSKASFDFSGGTLTGLNLFIVGYGRDSTGTANLTGGSITPNWDVQTSVGEGSVGTLTIGGDVNLTMNYYYIAHGANSTSHITHTGGTLYTRNDIVLGSASESTVDMTVTGGTLTSQYETFVGSGENSTATLDISGGTLAVGRTMLLGNGSGSSGTVNMSADGLITAGYVGKGSGTTASFNFNGGTLRKTCEAYEHEGMFLGAGLAVAVGANGGTLDIGSFATTNAATITGSGTLTKTGAARMTFSGDATGFTGKLAVGEGDVAVANAANLGSGTTISIAEGARLLLDTGADYTGEETFTLTVGNVTVTESGDLKDYVFGCANDAVVNFQSVTVENGTLTVSGPSAVMTEAKVYVVEQNHDFLQGLTIGSHAAIAVDMTGVVDAGSLAVDDTLVVFKTATAPVFEFAGDTLADSIFLAGPVFDYTLAFDPARGGVVATVTNVSNIARTRKVTEYIAKDNYIDQDAAWSNGQPTDYTGDDRFSHSNYDIAVFCNDATMHIWANGWGSNHNLACDKMAIRGSTVRVDHPNNWNPSLEKNFVVGHGVLELRRVGLQSSRAPRGTTVSVGENVSVRIVRTADNADTWLANATIDGDLDVTTGYTIFNDGIVLNGDALFANPEKNSYVSGSGTTGVAINGNWTIEDGCHFDFNNAVVSVGENATLTLKGNAWIEEYGNVGKFKELDLVDVEDMYFSSFTGASTNIVMKSGSLWVGATEVPEGAKLVVESGTVNLDFVGTAHQVDDVVTVQNLVIANEGDVAITVNRTDLTWESSVGEGGVVTLTATGVDTTPNFWVGGSGANWNLNAAWSKGVPLEHQTISFTNSTTAYLSGSYSISNIVVSANCRVLFQSASGDRQLQPKVMEGEGTVALHHAGIVPQVAMTIPASLTIEVVKVNEGNTSDSWLEGTASAGALTINAPIVGDGFVIFRRDVHLGGDNSGFTGKVVKQQALGKTQYNGVLYFDSLDAGSSNATWTVETDVNTSALGTGTLYFGALNTANQKAWYQKSGGTVVFEVGALNTDMNFGGNFFFGAELYNTGTNPRTTLRKTGTGKLTYASYGLRDFDIVDGEFALATPTHGDGQWGSYRDNHAGYQLDTVTVRDGAALSGTTDQTILALAFDPGAVLRSTLKAETATENDVTTTNGFSTVAWPTVAGEVGVEGVKVEFTNPEVLNDVLNGGDPGLKELASRMKYRLLNATRITGDAALETVLSIPGNGMGWSIRTVPGADSGVDLVLKRACRSFMIVVR